MIYQLHCVWRRLVAGCLILIACCAMAQAETVSSRSMTSTATFLSQLTPKTMPEVTLTALQVAALWRSAQHTAGTNGFVYRVALFRTEGEARRAMVNARNGRPLGAREYSASDLLSVPKIYRSILADLWVNGDVSDPQIVKLESGQIGWTVVNLVRRLPNKPHGSWPLWGEDALRFLNAGLLPTLEQALTDLDERSRQAYWFVRSVADLAQVPAEFNPNVVFGSFSTPLTRAVLRKDSELIGALLARGADPNQCSIWGCPLGLSIEQARDEVQAMAGVEQLLAAGAKPNQFDRAWSGANRTALGESLRKSYMRLADHLVKAGAAIDGVADVGETPLFSALLGNQRDAAEWLLKAGANVLPFPDERNKFMFGQRSLYALFTTEYGDVIGRNENEAKWARQLMVDAAKASKNYQFEVAVEQDGVRYPWVAGRAIRLKSKTFRLLVTYPDKPHRLVIAGSLDERWRQQVAQLDPRLPFFRPFAGAALIDAKQPDSSEMYLSDACQPPTDKNDICNGYFQFLLDDNDGLSTYHVRRPAERLFIRDIGPFMRDQSAEKQDLVPIPFNEMVGKTLHLLVASPLVLHPVSIQEIIHPRMIHIEFVRP